VTQLYTTKRSLIKVIEKEKSDVCLLIDIRFLVSPSTIKTCGNISEEVGGKAPVRETGSEA
jgi:hypothetical protein